MIGCRRNQRSNVAGTLIGSDRNTHPSDALAALHEISQGALREIDRLATAALREAARRKKKLVDRDVVTRVGEALLRFD